MTLWPFIAGAYAIGLIVPIGLGVQVALRLSAVRRRLAALDSGHGPR